MAADQHREVPQTEQPKEDVPASPIGNELHQISSNASVYDLHPIELTAHTLLSGSLDHLNENFKNLNQSQVILYTRLRLIEDRLKSYYTVIEQNQAEPDELKEVVSRIKSLKKRLLSSVKTLKKVEVRVERMEELID
ncbi:hypothetical protein CLIB1423_13S02850 [[Candida] railenensis]|uniref:Uncharacterized protein n=1 Tax=[Candida] railenensis TaxID=45579 RepID=A0A9P0QSI8_9ASCO|nr:hypothetical protein CLIB1423_13S02850 [[Candida] railenensis]